MSSFPYTFPITLSQDIGHFIDVPQTQSLRVLLWGDYNKTALLDDFTDSFTSLTFSTGLHGGFKTCVITIPMPLERMWLYFDRENLSGRLFSHFEILQEQKIVWEGRVMEVTFDPSGGRMGLTLTVMGYWSSCRDQFYDSADAGNTDWTSGTHSVDEIIKEMLTEECPDINTDQTNIDDSTIDVGGIDLTSRDYPQSIIVSQLPMTSDGTDQWHFSIWENRLPYFKQRTVSTLHWTTFTSELGGGSSISQSAIELKNSILPVKDGTEGTAAAQTDRRTGVPLREAKLAIQKGTPSGAENAARDRALQEKQIPQQAQRFIIRGRVWDTSNDGAFIGTPLWNVRAGQVLRIADLIPYSAAAAELDALRTFYIIETSYDAMTNTLVIVPDRPSRSLITKLVRSVDLEGAR